LFLHLKISSSIFGRIPNIELLPTPKKKLTQMRIKSNCLEKIKTIKVKWTGKLQMISKEKSTTDSFY